MTEGTAPSENARALLAVRNAAWRLRLDALAVEAVDALERDGLDPVLLKGPAVARWLYDKESERSYVDVDLLVDPGRLDEAEQVMDRLGLERSVDQRATDAFAEPHSVTWMRRSDGCMVDVHWRIPGIPASPGRAWHRLSSDVVRFSLGRRDVSVLGEPGRALHVALHALHNGREVEQSLADLARGIERAGVETWREAAALAVDLEATEALAAGLRMLPDGAALADRLDLPSEDSVRLALWAQTPPPGALRLYELAATRGAWRKVRWLGRLLVPPASYVRALYPAARESRAALTLAYFKRLAALRNLGPAIRAVRRARADSRRPRGRR